MRTGKHFLIKRSSLMKTRRPCAITEYDPNQTWATTSLLNHSAPDRATKRDRLVARCQSMEVFLQ